VKFRAAEFFAGIGLVRAAIERAAFEVVFANDIEPSKHAMYAANFDASDFVLGDVRNIHGRDVPPIDLATASFPCTDLSLAGNRAGLDGDGSGMFWEFARILDEMGKRRPRVIMLENVIGFATSHGGDDIVAAISRLNELGYRCDLLTLDAKWFVPQSRPRLFIVGTLDALLSPSEWTVSELRPAWVRAFVETHPGLAMQAQPLPSPDKSKDTIAGYMERMPAEDGRWWNGKRLASFLDSLSMIQAKRLAQLRAGQSIAWATAYRRTRQGSAVWEVRADALSGCLRTARGGSSKQAVVEAGRGSVRVRWMTATEYARLQGAPDFNIDGVRDSAAMFGFGDAVCVPVVAWLAKHYLRPLLERKFTRRVKPRSIAACRVLTAQ
jgi:DNA (cytosine-5)-methyltransferase 1